MVALQVLELIFNSSVLVLLKTCVYVCVYVMYINMAFNPLRAHCYWQQ